MSIITRVAMQRSNDMIDTMADSQKPYPIRINKYLADKGYCTRAGADELVKKGLVTINGRKALLGSKIETSADIVAVLMPKLSYHYYAYHKPRGIETINPQPGEKAVADIARFPAKVFPLGRLDKDSSGLLIMTDDGRLTKRLLEPRYEHEKEYDVTVGQSIDENDLKKLSRGVRIGDYLTKPCVVRRKGRNRFTIILTEGKNRQIRRMCQALGYEVTSLVRTRIMNISLGTIKKGTYQELKAKDREALLSSLGLNDGPMKHSTIDK